MRPVLILAALLAAAEGAPTLTAAVAANAMPALEEIRGEFRKRSGIEVKAVHGASGKLAAQIRNGAPFDVFVSADMDFPDSLHRSGHAPEAPRAYAYGRLVLWTLGDADLSRGLAAAADPAVRRIAIADPARAPYGREAVRALERAGLHEKVRGKLVLGENIAQAGQYLVTGHADLALTAKSLVLAPEARGRGRWVEVDASLHRPIAQGAVVLRHGHERDSAAAARFQAFLLSPEARAILARYGYSLP